MPIKMLEIPKSPLGFIRVIIIIIVALGQSHCSQENGVITGQVIDPTGAPVNLAKVWIWDKWTITDNEGIFSLDGINGPHILIQSEASYDRHSATNLIFSLAEGLSTLDGRRIDKLIIILTYPCFASEYIPPDISTNINYSEGWIDTNTLQSRAIGYAPGNITDISQRKRLSLFAAIFNAKSRCVELLIQANISGSTINSNGIPFSEIIRGNFCELIEADGIITEVYDSSTQACEIIYRIISRGLKRRAESGNW